MADYIVHGKKGNGKSLVCVGRIRDALLAGKPVATNLDLFLDGLLPSGLSTTRVFRLPDRPSIDDLLLIGRGSGEIDESTYGLIVLDECASMLNSRTFTDKGRAPFLDWFVHSRKLGWDSYFICQNPVQIDKQVRESLVELSVSCKRMDRLRFPFIGGITKNLFGFELRPPKVHVATVRYGTEANAPISDRWWYRGLELYRGYNTRQVFREFTPEGTYSLLTPWHLSAVIGPPGKSFVGPLREGKLDWVVLSERVLVKVKGKHMVKYLGLVFILGGLFGVGAYKYFSHPVVVAPAVSASKVSQPSGRNYSDSLKGVGLLRNGAVVSVVLSDGRMLVPLSLVNNGGIWEAEIESNLWVKGGSQ